jgi:pimeloyl-ACP methyl ester carboxylesterase
LKIIEDREMVVTQHQTTVDSLKINYYQAGTSGDPLVLLHGGGTDSAMLSWREAIVDLAQDFQVFAPDWPGYGASQEMSGSYKLENLVEILHGLLETWDIERASLVGLSMGGGAALGFALAHPQEVDKLILVDTYGIQKKAPRHRFSYLYIRVPFLVSMTWKGIRKDKSMVRMALRSIFANPNNITDELVDELFEAMQNSSSERSFYSFQRYEMTWKGVRTNYIDQLPEIQAPTLFIHGEKDLLVPLGEVKRAAELMTNAQVIVMEDAGHWAPREYPQKFNQWVRNFLKGLPVEDQLESEETTDATG